MHLRKAVKRKAEISFDEPLNTDFDGNVLLLSDVLGTDGDVIYKDVEAQTEKEILDKSFQKLSPREKRIMELRFGLYGNEEKRRKKSPTCSASVRAIFRGWKRR